MINNHWFYSLTEKCQTKLKNDIFYFSMVEKGFSYADLLKSGWIDTEYTFEDNIHQQQKFTSNILNSLYLKDSEEICILLNTGSYAPTHNGHIEMMLQAKKVVEKNGFFVDMIVLSPSHDGYVLNKSTDIKEWNIENRLNELYSKIQSYSYENLIDKNLFSIDLWESLYCNCPVNFTDVIFQIENNIKKYLNKRVKIFYVFGSDNHDFCNCFSSLPEYFRTKYFGVCVERKDYLNYNKIQSSNILYTKNELFSSNKSRQIRQFISNQTKINNINKDSIYGVRLDEDTALKNWIIKYPSKKEQLLTSYLEFHAQLKNIINKHTSIKTLSIPVINQREILIKENFSNILNLDVCTSDFSEHIPINYSRLFCLNDLQKKTFSIINRNNSNNNIKPGFYTLIDDDIASGSTLNLVKQELIKNNVLINESVSLLDLYLKEINNENEIYDIIDTRDFLIGANEGGLFCQTINGYTRIPYLSPWVNLCSRAKIPFKSLKKINLDIINLNILFFEKNKFIHFDDLPSNLNIFLLKNNNTTSIVDWCLKHFSYLNKNMS